MISKRRRAFRQAYNLRFLKRGDASFLRDSDIFLHYFKIKKLKIKLAGIKKISIFAVPKQGSAGVED
ncbi:hypothetical protein DRF68_20575 [Candidatus Chryseobacterium massiliae]|uniref:Uncharacterized protein n=1 Tax=Candidatus Chryseobacterium massiliense TaxID=204089 RepID=A0A3D9AF33_9FLAO|nr:hypothetical protein DRF68_20575 [Candidatus Chryseobacterium massiliae]